MTSQSSTGVQPGRASRARRSTVALAVTALMGAGLALPTIVPTAALANATEASQPEVPQEALVETGSTWKYLDDNSDPAGGDANLRVWTTPEYDDSAWSSAESGFGVKKNELAQVGSHMPKTKLNHYIDGVGAPTIPTYFFRTTFDLE